MSSTTNISLLGEATPDGIAIWICGAALIILLGALITKSKGSDLRFLTCCVLIGIFGILGFAFLSPRHRVTTGEPAPPAPLKPIPAPTTNPVRAVDDLLGDSPNISSQNARSSSLQSSFAGSGVTDSSQGN